MDAAQEAAAARMHGQWLCRRSNRGPKKAVTMAAASGNAGISHR